MTDLRISASLCHAQSSQTTSFCKAGKLSITAILSWEIWYGGAIVYIRGQESLPSTH